MDQSPDTRLLARLQHKSAITLGRPCGSIQVIGVYLPARVYMHLNVYMLCEALASKTGELMR